MKLTLVFVVILVAVAAAWYLAPRSVDRLCSNSELSRNTAFRMAQDVVKHRVNVLAAAHYPPFESPEVRVTWLGPCTFAVRGVVVSPNGASTPIRSDFGVLMRYYPSLRDWSASYLTF